MGVNVPVEWSIPPPEWQGTNIQWGKQVIEALGNGVVVQMARAFGMCYDSTFTIDPATWGDPEMPDSLKRLLAKPKNKNNLFD